MAVAQSSTTESSCFLANCYRVETLTDTILEANQTANLNDRYVLGQELGWGRFGVIRECYDNLTGEALACKSIAKDKLVTREDVQSIRLEIEIMTRLSGHSNVVALNAVYEDEYYVHLVMELCAGGELFHLLDKHGKFLESEAKVLFRDLMLVVKYCHDNGVIHRDLKPENILLASKGPSSPIKLADFGLATYIKQGQSLHGTVGSPFYIAPEVLMGGYDQAADVWSAGVILYILLSGVPPFWGRTKSQIFDVVRAADLRFPSDSWDCISSSAKELIRQMLCKDPSRRLTAQQVLDHSWMKDSMLLSKERFDSNTQSCYGVSSQKGSFFMDRDQDISFTAGLSLTINTEFPTFTCRSSFSSLMLTPTPINGCESAEFSFGSCSGEIAPPVLSLPSFSFFSPGSMFEQGNGELSLYTGIPSVDSLHQEGSLGTQLMPDSILSFGNVAPEVDPKIDKAKRVGSRMSSIHRKRNNTISLGEVEQLDIMVTESVIRWASCTTLPTPMSPPFVC